MNDPVTVAYYSDALTTGGRYGLSRYAWQLLGEVRKFDPALTVRPVSAHVKINTAEVDAMKRDLGYVPLPYPRKLIAGCWASLGYPLLERWTPWADVVHGVELDYRIATRKPLVVTIHDLGPLTHPQFFGSSHPWLLKQALRSAARRADSIICVSQATADATEGYLRQSLGDRLTVVPEGVSAEFFETVPAEVFEKTGAIVAAGVPFFLWAGSLNPRKNLPRVVEAFERLAARLPHHLILTGGIGWDADPILARVADSNLKHRIHLPGRVSDDELRGLYQRATAFVYASLMEGFGLPILEAMASGCPVITSKTSSMPEVAGDAAVLVDPTSIEEISGAMESVAADASFAAQLRPRGRARAEGFRWDHCAAGVARIYERVRRNSLRRKACPSRSQKLPIPVS